MLPPVKVSVIPKEGCSNDFEIPDIKENNIKSVSYQKEGQTMRNPLVSSDMSDKFRNGLTQLN